MRLWANSARIDFKTDIDWHDRRILLKARFPLAIHTEHATFECAHGVISRPTHRNTSWDQARFEVAAHRFVDMSEHGYGVTASASIVSVASSRFPVPYVTAILGD